MPSPISSLYEFGEFRLDPQKRILYRGKELVPLTPKAFETLLVLVRSNGHVVTKDELMNAVWSDSFVEESNLTQTVFMLRKALGETPEQRYILTIPGRGYRIAVDVKETARNGHTTVETPSPPSVREVESKRKHAPYLFLLGGLLILISAIVIYSQWLGPRARQQSATGRLMLAVLPFQNLTGDPAEDYLSDGLTEEMISQLGGLDPQKLGVIARTSVMHYKNDPVPLDQVGRALGVQYVLEGSVRRDAEHVRVAAQLIQLRDQTHLWAREYDREFKDLLVLQSEIAREIADEIQLTLGDRFEVNSAHHRSTAPTTSYEAYDLYLKGRYFWNKRTPDGFQRAAEYFQQAIGKDPNYAGAYAGLADTYALMSTWSLVPQNEIMPKARTAALKALEIDETLAEAHTSLGLIGESYDYDWQTAEKEFRRAIQLNPDYATAHQWYAEYLSWQGRFEEAFAESERARQLDPLSLIIATDHAAILYYSRQYDRAIAQSRAALEMDPHFSRAHALIAYSFVQESRFAEALDECDHLQVPEAWTWAWRAYIYGRWGRTAEAEHALSKFEQLGSKLGPDRTLAMLLVYVGTGRKDLTIALLQKAYSEHSNVVVPIKVDPNYDSLRNDPRFHELLRRMGLDQ